MTNETETIKMPENVIDFMKKCGTMYGEITGERFEVDFCNIVQDYRIESPIEQILLSALLSVTKINHIPSTDPIERSDYILLDGLDIDPQFEIANFRVDFLISYYKYYKYYPRTKECKGKKIELIVECDSQEWHDRSEKGRRYEKMRERYLVSKGYKIFRYTGREILNDPFDIAAEIISYLTGDKKEDLDYYDGSL